MTYKVCGTTTGKFYIMNEEGRSYYKYGKKIKTFGINDWTGKFKTLEFSDRRKAKKFVDSVNKVAGTEKPASINDLDKLMNSERFGEVTVEGKTVKLRKFVYNSYLMTDGSGGYKKTKKPREVVVINAYVELKGSQHLSESALGYPTFREGDIVGVDTAHSWNDNMTEAQKVLESINQIEGVIKSWRENSREAE